MNRVGSAAALLGMLLQASSAHAYNWETHVLIVNQAVTAMPGPNEAIPPPSGASPTAWTSYVNSIKAAPARLGLLRTGLTAEVVHSKPDKCNWYPSDNLARIADFRLREFPYQVERLGAEPCGLLGIDAPNPGQVLGWHAATVDDRINDTTLWVRPTNAFLLGEARLMASTFWQIGAGALLLPAMCIGNLLSGDGCDLDASFDLAGKYNPIEYMDGWIPGFGKIQSDQFTGLWHFINVRSPVGRYNDDPGMFYPLAGPNNVPGALDVGITLVTSESGLSVNADESDGVARYGQYDRVGRGKAQWQAYPIGLIEFSSLDNLAKYGFERFLNGKNDARGLAWPLHALGDAAAPHHVVGTTSWGHRPYEDYVQRHWEELVPFESAQRLRIVQAGFKYWSAIQASGDVRQLVRQLANKTSELSDSGPTVDWPFDDSRSVGYEAFDKLGEDGLRSDSIEAYHSDRDRIRPLVEEGMAATLAFLAYVSDIALVTDCAPGRCDATTQCGAQSYFSEQLKQCTGGAPPAPVVRPPLPVCGAGMSSPECPQGAADAGVCGTRASCNATTPCPPGFFCLASCCQEIPE